MSDSPPTCVTVDEEVPLNLIAGSGDAQNNDNCHQESSSKGHRSFCRCDDRHHRTLAICSIICGISCIGIKSLINSVKAETTEAESPVAAARFSRKAKKYGIMSIVIWILILCLIPTLMALISYLLTLQD